MGICDIYLDGIDSNIKHDAMKYLDVENLKNTPYWNKEKWNEYAKKKAAFLMLASELPGLMDDIDPKKIKELVNYSQTTRKVFDKKRAKSELLWTIAAVPTESWAKKVFPKSEKRSVDRYDIIGKARPAPMLPIIAKAM